MNSVSGVDEGRNGSPPIGRRAPKAMDEENRLTTLWARCFGVDLESVSEDICVLLCDLCGGSGKGTDGGGGNRDDNAAVTRCDKGMRFGRAQTEHDEKDGKDGGDHLPSRAFTPASHARSSGNTVELQYGRADERHERMR